MCRIAGGSKTLFQFLILVVALIFKVSQCNNFSRETSSVATIEVLAIVDHTLADILGSDQVINDYISANWNAANRFYRQFKNPEVHLKLVGLKILRTEAEETFFVFYPWTDGKSYLHWSTLSTMHGWIYENRDKLPKNDLVYLHYGIRNWEGRGNNRGKGFCDKSMYGKPVAYGDTWGEGSSTPRVTAHEVGHTIGCGHCDKSGYVMCSGDKVSGFYEECEKVVYDTMKSLLGKCVSTFEATEDQLSQFNFNRTIMPGDVVSLDVQCERYNQAKGAKAIIAESDCDNLLCLMPNGEKKKTNIPAVGTRELCPTGQRCLEGICKAE